MDGHGWAWCVLKHLQIVLVFNGRVLVPPAVLDSSSSRTLAGRSSLHTGHQGIRSLCGPLQRIAASQWCLKSCGWKQMEKHSMTIHGHNMSPRPSQVANCQHCRKRYPSSVDHRAQTALWSLHQYLPANPFSCLRTLMLRNKKHQSNLRRCQTENLNSRPQLTLFVVQKLGVVDLPGTIFG